jgi:hypothetical protein
MYRRRMSKTCAPYILCGNHTLPAPGYARRIWRYAPPIHVYRRRISKCASYMQVMRGAYQNAPPICRLCEAHIEPPKYAPLICYARSILSPQNMRLLYVMRGTYWAPKICASYIVWILTFLKFEFWLFCKKSSLKFKTAITFAYELGFFFVIYENLLARDF